MRSRLTLRSIKPAVDTIREQRYENSNDMVAFLTEVNPYFNKDELQSMLHTHLDLSEEYFRLYLKGRYDSTKIAEEVAFFDVVMAQALDIADYISAGIITQFGDDL